MATVWEQRLEKINRRREAALRTVESLEKQGYFISDSYKEMLTNLGKTKTRYSQKELDTIQNLTNANVIRSRAKKSITSTVKERRAEATLNVSASKWMQSPAKTAAEAILKTYREALKRAPKYQYASVNGIQNTFNQIDINAGSRLGVLRRGGKIGEMKKNPTQHLPSKAELERAIKDMARKMGRTEEDVATEILQKFLKETPAATAEGYRGFQEEVTESAKEAGIGTMVGNRFATYYKTWEYKATLRRVAEWLYNFFEFSVWWAIYRDKINPSDFVDYFYEKFLQVDGRAEFDVDDFEKELNKLSSPKSYKVAIDRYSNQLQAETTSKTTAS